MTAYENGLKSSDTRFLLRPDSDFFRYFGNPSGKPPAASAAARAAAQPRRRSRKLEISQRAKRPSLWPDAKAKKKIKREVPVR